MRMSHPREWEWIWRQCAVSCDWRSGWFRCVGGAGLPSDLCGDHQQPRHGGSGGAWPGAQIEAMSYLPGSAFGVAAATLAGQSLGAADQRRAVRSVLLYGASAVAIMGAAGLIMFISPVNQLPFSSPVNAMS